MVQKYCKQSIEEENFSHLKTYGIWIGNYMVTREISKLVDLRASVQLLNLNISRYQMAIMYKNQTTIMPNVTCLIPQKFSHHNAQCHMSHTPKV